MAKKANYPKGNKHKSKPMSMTLFISRVITYRCRLIITIKWKKTEAMVAVIVLCFDFFNSLYFHKK